MSTGRMSAGPAPGKKPPARPVAEVRADIERERAALQGAFETLRHDLDDAVDEGRRRVADVGRKARLYAPVAAGAVVTLAVAGRLLRRRSVKKE